MQHSQSKALKWSLIVGIVIVLNLFFNYSFSLLYPAPTYENFCPSAQVNNPPTTEKECVAAGGQWNAYQPVPANQPPLGGKMMPYETGYCNTSYTCQKNFDASYQTFSRNIFVILVVLGIISIVASFFFASVDAISIALAFGGVLSVVIASMRYWSSADNLVHVIILGAALVALIWLGVKKFGPQK